MYDGNIGTDLGTLTSVKLSDVVATIQPPRAGDHVVVTAGKLIPQRRHGRLE
jgi:hypothetical protein